MNMPKAAKVELNDCGLRALDFLFSSMMIDAEWSTRQKRGFEWWGHGHAQRAWAEPPREDRGAQVSLVHVETDLLRNVEDSDQTYVNLDQLQHVATLFSFTFLPAQGKIRMHSTVYLHEGNCAWLDRVLLNAAGLQLLMAASCQALLEGFPGSEPDTTPHPRNGCRATPDELIKGLREFYNGAKNDPVSVPRGCFREACRTLKECNLLASPSKTRLMVEFHFVGDHPALARQLAGKTGVETSLFGALVDVRHVIMGNGLTSLLTLPAEKPRAEGPRWCGRMNLQESQEWTGFHLLGAWATIFNGEDTVFLGHRGFLPAFPVQPELVVNLALANGLRSKWVSSRLGEG